MSTEFDLYEYPADHVGRKRYVHVEGHRRSVPSIYTYRGYDGKNKVHPEYGGEPYEAIGGAPMVMRDISEYKSPLDGSVISSRSSHREHMRAHDVIEVGTEKMGSMRGSERAPMQRAGYDVKRAIEMLNGGYRPDMRQHGVTEGIR